VLYIAHEGRREDVKKHFRQLDVRPDEELHVYIGPAPENPIDWLRAAITRRGAKLAIIDTLARFARIRDMDDYAEATQATGPLIALAAETGCHLLSVHHAGKGERSGTDAVLGSTALSGFADTILVMKRHADGTRTLETIQRTGTDLPESVVTLDATTGEVVLGGSLDERRVAAAVEEVVRVVGPEVRTEQAIRDALAGDRRIVGLAIRQAHK